MAAQDPTSPTSWRDVYALVRDTRSDVLEAVSAVNEKVEAHLSDHKEQADYARAHRHDKWATLRVTIQTLLPVPATVIALLALYASVVNASAR